MSKGILRKTDINRRMATSHEIILASSSDSAKATKPGLLHQYFLKVTGIRRISIVQILSKAFLFYVED